MNWKEYGKKRSWPTFKVQYYPSIGLEGLRNTTKNLRISCLRAETLTCDLQNTKQEC
jgi:hypothetical protein